MPPPNATEPPACVYLVSGEDGAQRECGAPAAWRRHTVTLCETHARQVSEKFPLLQIGGPGELDRRTKKRVVRRYCYNPEKL